MNTPQLTALWNHFLPHARIRMRIVAAVVLAMTAVLLLAGGFVFWRVSFALDRQLNQDLRAYTDLVTSGLEAGDRLPADKPGLVSQTFATDGRVLDKSDRGVRTLLTDHQIRSATSRSKGLDLGRFLPPSGQNPYRVRYLTAPTPQGTVVVATAISRRKHDEALHELLLQLCLADLATIAAAALVGWGATRAALDPVERYRRAAASAGGDPTRRLPVDDDRDDELTRLGTTFNALLAEIEQGEQRERQFLADASHELRSPLALLAAEVEWAQHRPRTATELDRVLTSIGGQIERLVDLSNALLDLEELQAGVPTDPVPTPLNQVLDQGIDGLVELAHAQGRELNIEATSVPVPVNPRWFGLAVANLVTNALKHGRGAITVRGVVEHGRLSLTVTDEGGGIPPALGTQAFDRFARADASRSTVGNGLGLALVKAVAERHDGTAKLVRGGVTIEVPLR
jgi:signal transduction histidine kinase